MQELACNLLRCDQFHRATTPNAYALRAATNLAFGYRRSHRKSLLSEVPLDDVSGIVTSRREHSPLSNLVRREELNRVLDSIAHFAAGMS